MFWGLTIEPGKHYTQTVQESFHLSMVALDTRDVTTSDREHSKISQLMIQHDKAEFLVCTLRYGTVFQQTLDLNFTEGEEITFFTEGRGTLHLTGYLVKDEPVSLDSDDMVGLNELSSSDAVESDSEGWASGEESTGEGQIHRQHSYSAQAYRKNTSNKTTSREKCALSSKQLPRKYNRKPNRGEWRSNSSAPWHVIDEGSRIRKRRPSLGLQEQQAILRTSNNVVATLVLSDSPAIRRPGMAVSAGSLRHKAPPYHKIRKRRLAQEMVTRPGWRTTESQDPDMIMLSDSATPVDNHEDVTYVQRRTSSVSGNSQTQVEPESTAASSNAGSLTRICILPVDQTCTMIKEEPSSSMTTAGINSNSSDTCAGKSSSQTNPTAQLKMPSKKPAQKSTVPCRSLQIQRLGKRIPMQARKRPQQRKGINKKRKVTAAPRTTVQSNQPVISNVVGGREAAKICRLHADFSSRMAENGNNIAGHSESLHQTDAQQTHPDQPQPFLTALDHQPGHGVEPLVPNSLIDNLCPIGDQSSMPECSSNEQAWLSPQGMSGITWGCQSETDQVVDQKMATPVDSFPVASEMDFLSHTDLLHNGMNIGKELLRLVPGFDVFIARWEFFQVGIVAVKGWKILIRRLLDVFFDRATLAASSPSTLDNGSFGYKLLDQTIVAAVSAFIEARYEIPQKRIKHAICSYCSDCRKGRLGKGHPFNKKTAMSSRPVLQSLK